jgi:hypothetical protein
MLTILTVIVMLSVGYAFFLEGLFTAVTMCLNVLIAGLVAFNFWEPLADLLDPAFTGSAMDGYEDAFILAFLFVGSLALLRLVTNNLAPAVIDYTQVPQQGGAAVVGLLTGYLVCGFFICLMQTIPWHKNFMGFEARVSDSDGLTRELLPPDRVWLALMRRVGAYSLSSREDPSAPIDPNSDTYYYDRAVTFDKYATFELRYERYRRYGDSTNPPKYQGELDRELHRPVP